MRDRLYQGFMGRLIYDGISHERCCDALCLHLFLPEGLETDNYTYSNIRRMSPKPYVCFVLFRGIDVSRIWRSRRYGIICCVTGR
jgi:hypothetical protein